MRGKSKCVRMGFRKGRDERRIGTKRDCRVVGLRGDVSMRSRVWRCMETLKYVNKPEAHEEAEQVGQGNKSCRRCTWKGSESLVVAGGVKGGEGQALSMDKGD